MYQVSLLFFFQISRYGEQIISVTVMLGCLGYEGYVTFTDLTVKPIYGKKPWNDLSVCTNCLFWNSVMSLLYSFVYCSTTSSPGSSRFSLWRCYSDMGILASVLGIPIPKTLVIWASPSHITLAFWVRVRVRGDPHIIRVLGMGMPKTRGCPLISLWQQRGERSSLLENKRTLGRGCTVLFL